MKDGWKVAIGPAMVAFAMTLWFASAALAHGGLPDGHGHSQRLLGVDLEAPWLQPALALGLIALFGVVYAITGRKE